MTARRMRCEIFLQLAARMESFFIFGGRRQHRKTKRQNIFYAAITSFYSIFKPKIFLLERNLHRQGWGISTASLNRHETMTRRIRHCAKDEAGFSFAELMVVIALIGILSAIALPSLLGNLPEKRLKNAARNLYSDMQRVRLQAVKENTSLTVTFDPDKDAYSYLISGTTKEVSLTEYGDVKFGCDAAPSLDGKSASETIESVAFSKTGTATSGIIFLGSSNVKACYAVEVTGIGTVKIRWQQDGGSWN